MIKVVNVLQSATHHQTSATLLAMKISVAFDILDHNHWLERTKTMYSFDDIVLRWMQSYDTFVHSQAPYFRAASHSSSQIYYLID